MRTLLTLAAASLALTTLAQPDPAPNGYPLVLSPAQVVAAGPHDRLWQSLTVDSPGVTNTHTYVEVATGLNCPGPNATWLPTVEAFQITADGYAVATNGQHQVIIGPDLTAAGAIDFLGPDDERLVSNPMGLAYSDASSGQSVFIAAVTNSPGELTEPNVITFPKAFTTVRAALNYTYTRSGVAQDVILYQQLPSPQAFSLNPSTTVVEIWTEFLDPPQPAISSSADASDQTLDFGVTQMGRGFAYLLNASSLQKVPLQKTWTNIVNRSFLIESIPYQTLKPLLDTLQAKASQPAKAQWAKFAFPSRKAMVATAFQPRQKPRQTAAIRVGRPIGEKGVLLDYQTINTSQSNYTFAIAGTQS